MEVLVKTAAWVLASCDMQPTQVGNNDIHQIEPNLQANILDNFLQVAPCMDNHVMLLVPIMESELKLNVDEDNGLKEANKEEGRPICYTTQ